MYTNTDLKKTRAIIDLDVLSQNYLYTKKMCAPAKVGAVVKADAYGHGAVRVASRLAADGCDFFAVATVDEALELRAGGITQPVLILGYVLDNFLENAISPNISLALDSVEHLEKIIEVAAGRHAKIHIKIDTGMNRTGFPAKNTSFSPELKEAVKLLKNNENIECEGIFSHFALADEPDGEDFTKKQYERFCETVKALEQTGIHPKIKHICNSSAIVGFPYMHLDAVRMGISLYGCADIDKAYKPCMQFKTVIVNIHKLSCGEGVSYGQRFVADKDMRIAVIGAGYADGLKRCLSCSKGYVLCHGKKAPILGIVCMDMTIVDVSDIPEAKVGDDAVIFGSDSGAYLSADEVAERAGTIPYEILCSVSSRVPRVYIDSRENDKNQ